MRVSPLQSTGRVIQIALVAATVLPLGMAVAATADHADLETRLALLEADYKKLESETAARLANMRAEIATLRQVAANSESRAAATAPVAVISPSPGLAPARLAISGDARLRAESNSSHDSSPVRNRGAVRVRLTGDYAFSEQLNAGMRLVTGDPNDPNSSDVTLGNFVDDFAVSLDRAYLRYTGDNWQVVGGKIANPFVGTDLVWDGDVNPLGFAATATLPLSETSNLRATGIYSIVDEQTLERDSDMWGGQLTTRLAVNDDWQIDAAFAYYDYTIGSLVNAGAGDTRDNILTPDGLAYLSDFDLANAIVELRYNGFGDAWPIILTGDWVRNLGAASAEDRGYSFNVALGRRSEARDWRIRYGIAVAETDAVLGIFSHDNTEYASNYRQHTLQVEHVLRPNLWLDLTAFYFKRNRFDATMHGDLDYRLRTRFSVNVAY